MIRRLPAVAAACGVALATAAHAQPPAPHHAPEAETKARHEAMRQQHLQDLRTVLRLRPDQEAALGAFIAAHEPRTFKRPQPESEPLTTPQRLETMARHEAEMRAQHERMRQALTAFYAALSPDQQKVFDALHRLRGPHGAMGLHAGPHRAHGGPRMVIHRRGPMAGTGAGEAPH